MKSVTMDNISINLAHDDMIRKVLEHLRTMNYDGLITKSQIYAVNRLIQNLDTFISIYLNTYVKPDWYSLV